MGKSFHWDNDTSINKDNTALIEEDGINATDSSQALRDNAFVAGGNVQQGGIDLDGLDLGDGAQASFTFQDTSASLFDSALDVVRQSTQTAVDFMQSQNATAQENFTASVDAANAAGEQPKSTTIIFAVLSAFLGFLGIITFLKKK